MKWDKTTKDKISYIVATLAFVFGIGLTVAGFVVAPLGIIDSSVLWVLGQCLTYSGAVFGVGLYVNNSKQIIHSMIEQSKLE
jgi:hypothetical protein